VHGSEKTPVPALAELGVSARYRYVQTPTYTQISELGDIEY
jgi:hypothetical protein